jgi:hypothetical protein
MPAWAMLTVISSEIDKKAARIVWSFILQLSFHFEPEFSFFIHNHISIYSQSSASLFCLLQWQKPIRVPQVLCAGQKAMIYLILKGQTTGREENGQPEHSQTGWGGCPAYFHLKVNLST